MQSEETALAGSDDKSAPCSSRAKNVCRVRRATSPDLQVAFGLVEEYFQEINVVLRDTRAEFAGYLESENGGVWLAFDGEQSIGCIVLHPLVSLARGGEIKRLYVRASHRGQGLAGSLLRALELRAIQLQYEWLYLDTKDDLYDAIRFYERHGYERCSRYNNNPQATIFMRKRLAGVSASPY